MPTFIEALPASKTHEHRGIRWTPCEGHSCACSGRLQIIQGKRGQDSATYLLTEFPPDAGFGDGRAFRLDKADGSEGYNLFVAANPQDCLCDCAGFAYGRGRPCKHVTALRALLENNWLPHPGANPDADAGATETDLDALVAEWQARHDAELAAIDARYRALAEPTGPAPF